MIMGMKSVWIMEGSTPYTLHHQSATQEGNHIIGSDYFSELHVQVTSLGIQICLLKWINAGECASRN
jgi:hypothetical protein